MQVHEPTEEVTLSSFPEAALPEDEPGRPLEPWSVMNCRSNNQ